MKNRLVLLAVLVMLLMTESILCGQKPLKILSYNILEGLKGDSLRTEKFISWVKKIDPDIIGFQEMNNFTQQRIEKFAAAYGHNYAVLSKTDGYPVALTSRYPIVDVQKVVDNMWHAYIVANINNVNVIVIHFSPWLLSKRQLEVNEIIARAGLFPDNEMVVIMGDFNSLSSRDASHYSEEDLVAQKQREIQEPHIRNLNNGHFDYTVTGALEKAGFTDLVYKHHKDFQYSIPTPAYSSKYRKRIDFIYANKTLTEYSVSADIIRDNVTDTISDHYPVLATFGIR